MASVAIPLTSSLAGVIQIYSTLRTGIISTVDGIYRNPSTNDTLSLDDAVQHGLICGEILDAKRKTEERILDSTNIVARSVDEVDGEPQSHESSLQVLLPTQFVTIYF